MKLLSHKQDLPLSQVMNGPHVLKTYTSSTELKELLLQPIVVSYFLIHSIVAVLLSGKNRVVGQSKN